VKKIITLFTFLLCTLSCNHFMDSTKDILDDERLKLEIILTNVYDNKSSEYNKNKIELLHYFERYISELISIKNNLIDIKNNTSYGANAEVLMNITESTSKLIEKRLELRKSQIEFTVFIDRFNENYTKWRYSESLKYKRRANDAFFDVYTSKSDFKSKLNSLKEIESGIIKKIIKYNRIAESEGLENHFNVSKIRNIIENDALKNDALSIELSYLNVERLNAKLF